jgi:CubicO group peptidase (beta-lactamase class C family)
MMKLSIIRLLIFLFIAVSLSTGLANEHAEKIDDLMQTYFNNGQFNGSILVSEGGKVIYKKGFGLADMEWQIANTADTKFRLASITKQFTATLIMQLVEEGKITLDGKLNDFLPYYRKDTGDRVTIHHLLTHTSGIPNFTSQPEYGSQVMRTTLSPESLVVKYCMGNLEFEPGTQSRYSNSAYNILGAIIEYVTGKTYEQVLQERIFGPLKMDDSGYDHSRTLLSKRAAGYEKSFDGYRNASFLDMSVPYSAGALYSTVEDLYLWDRGLYTDQILTQVSLEKMFTADLEHYGYGWGIYYIPVGGDSVKAVAHSGGINGFNSRIMRILADQHLIVVLTNAPGAPLPQLVLKIAAILYDQSYELPKKYASDEIARVLMAEGTHAAETRFTQIKQEESASYEFSEGQFNQLGYALIAAGKLPEAIAVFKMNVENNPGSANVYDSLAEAYMISGQIDHAIRNYEKALQMLDKDPNISDAFRQRLREGAKKNLEKLKGSK